MNFKLLKNMKYQMLINKVLDVDTERQMYASLWDKGSDYTLLTDHQAEVVSNRIMWRNIESDWFIDSIVEDEIETMRIELDTKERENYLLSLVSTNEL